MAIAPRDYAAALVSAVSGRDEKDVPAAVARFVAAMRRRGLAVFLPQVLAALPRVLRERAHGVVKVESVRPLTEEETAAAVRALGLKPEEVTVEAFVKAELLGGVRVATGDRVLDATAKRRLADLARRLGSPSAKVSGD